MAEQESVSAPESFDNPGPSSRETSMEGKNPSSTELVQAIVADQGFITQLSSAIMAQMAPQLRSVNTHNTAVLQGQADGSQSPGVSQDQTGTQTFTLPGVSYEQTGPNEQSNPTVSQDRSGTVKRARAHVIDVDVDECLTPAKRVRVSGDVALELETNNELEELETDNMLSPNSRWEASEGLSQFLESAVKRLNKFDRKMLVKTYPRPNVDVAFTPAMDEYLKPFIQGVTTPDKPHKELQDKVLDILGPLCTVFENLANMESSIDTDGVIQLDATSVHNFLECIKHALMLTGDVASQISTTRRELVLKKINPLMVSLAQEEFSNTNKSLFAPGFEQRLKTRSETAETIGKAVRAGKPFFRGAASRGFGHRLRGGRQGFRFKTFRPFSARGNTTFNRGARSRGRSSFPRFPNPQSFTSQQ